MYHQTLQRNETASKWMAAGSYLYARRFVFIAILVHAVLIVLFGDYILLSSWFKSEEAPIGNFVSAPKAIAPVMEDLASKNLEVSDVQHPQEAAVAPKIMDVLTTTSSQTFNLPSTDDGVVSKLMDSSSLGSAAGSGIGSGIGRSGAGSGVGTVSAKTLFGTSIEAKNLAVILDLSGSMDDILPIVKEEVLKQFPDAVVIFCMGCSFLSPTENKHGANAEQPFHWKKVNKIFPEYKSSQFFRRMGEAVDYATTVKNVDGVWLVSDFRDKVNESLVDGLLGKCRQEKKKLYIHSVELSPADCLMKLSSGSGGKVNIAPIKDRAQAANNQKQK
jgi:hypothetical protein